MPFEPNNGMTCPLESGDMVQIVGRVSNPLARHLEGKVTTVIREWSRSELLLKFGAQTVEGVEYWEIDETDEKGEPWVAARPCLMKLFPPDEPEEEYHEQEEIEKCEA
jgi:hypothetical protein